MTDGPKSATNLALTAVQRKLTIAGHYVYSSELGYVHYSYYYTETGSILF